MKKRIYSRACPKCNKHGKNIKKGRLKCTNSTYDLTSGIPLLVDGGSFVKERRYKCNRCGLIIYTQELLSAMLEKADHGTSHKVSRSLSAWKAQVPEGSTWNVGIKKNKVQFNLINRACMIGAINNNERKAV